MVQALTTAGGVALMLFAIRFLRKGLDRLFGVRLGVWMSRMAESRLRAFFTGVGAAMLAPSSTTMSVLAVQTVQDRHLSARQMFTVILGADIGLTIMVVLIALRLDGYAPILLLIGVFLFQFTKGARSRGIGQVLVSVGFIFLGIGIIRQAATQATPSDQFRMLIEAAGNYPAVLAAIAAVLAVCTQSATATIGLVIGLGLAGTVDLTVAAAAVIGANVGISLNTLLVGWQQVESRRLGLANVLSKLAVAILALAALPWLTRWLALVPGGIDKQTAVGHVVFNVVRAAIFLPVVTPMSNLMTRLVSARQNEEAVFGPRYLGDAPRDSVTLALGMSLREILRTSEIIREMLEDVWRALKTCDAELARRVQDRDDQVDLLDDAIKKFLARMAADDASDQGEAAEIMRQLRYIAELETIGDVIDKNLAEQAIKRAERHIRFSDEGWAELDDYFQKVRENVLIAENAFHSRDPVLARRLLRHKEKIDEQERVLRDRHFARLRSGVGQSHESSAIHLDVLTHLKRINSCVTHVAYAIVGSETE